MSDVSPFAVTDIRMNIYWSLRNLTQAPEEWQFYVGYTPIFESSILQNRFHPDEWRIDRPPSPGLGRLITLIDNEVRPRLPDRPGVREGRLTFKVEGGLRHVTHYPISFLEHIRPETIFWSRLGLVGREEKASDHGFISVHELTAASRAAVRELDQHAIDACYRRFEATLRTAANIPAELRLPRRRISAFISYRVTRQPLAERVHALLSESHPIFKPYLDRHDLRGGREWEAQLITAIHMSNLFIPIVTADYGASGMTERELDEAFRVAAERRWIDFIHPVLLPDRAGDVAEQLQRLQGLSVSGFDELVPGKKWDDFVKRLLDAGVRE